MVLRQTTIYPDVTERCPCIGPPLVLMFHYRYSILTHWSPICKTLNIYNKVGWPGNVNQITLNVFESQICIYQDALMGRRRAVVAALLMYWSYCRPAPNHQCIQAFTESYTSIGPASGLLSRCWAGVGPAIVVIEMLPRFFINPLIPSA